MNGVVEGRNKPVKRFRLWQDLDSCPDLVYDGIKLKSKIRDIMRDRPGRRGPKGVDNFHSHISDDDPPIDMPRLTLFLLSLVYPYQLSATSQGKPP